MLRNKQGLLVAAIALGPVLTGCAKAPTAAGTLSPVPENFLGTWFNGDWSRGDTGELITLKNDWTFERYVRFDKDSRALGKFYIRSSDDCVVIEPKYYAVDAKRCGGSAPREFAFTKVGGTTCLVRNGIMYWREGRPPKGP